MPVKLYNVFANRKKEILTERFERKFYLTPREVGLAHGILRQICLRHSKYPSEQINSLYFDSPDLDQHERSASGDFIKDKVRIRWYGEDKDMDGIQPIYIELKSKQGFACTKQRFNLMVPGENLASNNLRKGIIPKSIILDTLTRFSYFHNGMLHPVIKISYWRYRFVDIITGQQLSLDCHIRSTMILPGSGRGEGELESPGAVIEIKGQTMELPTTLKRLRMLDTDWTRFSKYSACVDSHIEKPGSVGRLSPSGRIVWPN